MLHATALPGRPVYADLAIQVEAVVLTVVLVVAVIVLIVAVVVLIIAILIIAVVLVVLVIIFHNKILSLKNSGGVTPFIH